MENFRSLYKFKLKKNDLHGGLRLKKKKVSKPLLSIITVVLNQEKHLENFRIFVVYRSACNFSILLNLILYMYIF